VIPILPTTPTDLAHLNLRIKTLKEKGLTHALKKAPGSKKRKKNADKTTTSDSTQPHNTNGATTTSKPSSDEDKNPTKSKTTNGNKTNDTGIKNSATASLTRKVMQEQEERNKRRKLGQNENVKSLFNSSDNKLRVGNSADYMTRGFSLGKK
jgi:hypothetical protein